LLIDFDPEIGTFCVELLWRGYLVWVALPIDDGLQPPKQGLDGVPEELHRIFHTLIEALQNTATT
jgi:hypothetical protein